MKLLAIFSICFVLMFFDCASKNNKSVNNEAKQGQVEKNMREFLSYENVEDGIEYKFKAEMKKAGNYNGVEYKNDFVEVEYKLNNTSDKDFIIYNQGHSGSNSSVVYVEPQEDGTIEVSQRAFEEPKDRNCPDRFVAIMPNGSWLKSKQKITKKVQVELPLQPKTPFDDCEPQPKMPKEIKKVKFCIGFSEADSKNIKISEQGYIQRIEHIKEQKLMCSELVELK